MNTLLFSSQQPIVWLQNPLVFILRQFETGSELIFQMEKTHVGLFPLIFSLLTDSNCKKLSLENPEDDYAILQCMIPKESAKDLEILLPARVPESEKKVHSIVAMGFPGSNANYDNGSTIHLRPHV